MPSSGPAKICHICHQDCSRKPRAKDPLGQYACEECLAQRKAEASLRAGADPASVAQANAALPDLPDDASPFTSGFDVGPPKELWKRNPGT